MSNFNFKNIKIGRLNQSNLDNKNATWTVAYLNNDPTSAYLVVRLSTPTWTDKMLLRRDKITSIEASVNEAIEMLFVNLAIA